MRFMDMVLLPTKKASRQNWRLVHIHKAEELQIELLFVIMLI